MDFEASVAVKTGNVENLEKLLSDGTVKNINAQDHNGQTLLHHATINGHKDIIVCLLEYSADVLIQDKKNCTALHLALTNSESPLAKVILENVGRDELRKLLDMKIHGTGYSALHIAAENNRFMDASILLHYRANFELTNKAGKKPIDLTRPGKLRELLQVIDSTFNKAKHGDTTLLDDLKNFNLLPGLYFTPILNCKNAEGHTLMHTLIQRTHVSQNYLKLAMDLLSWRVTLPIDLPTLYDLERHKEVDLMSDLTINCLILWTTCQEVIVTLTKQPDIIKIICDMLESLHEVLLLFREFSDKPKLFPPSLKLWALEELFEVLFGIDPTKRLCVKKGQNYCYYEKLPGYWKQYCGLMIDVLEALHLSTIHFKEWISNIRIFHAVEANDMDKVQKIMRRQLQLQLIVNNIDPNGRTVLCHAVEQGKKKMVRLLLNAGAKMTVNATLSQDMVNRWTHSFYVAVAKGKAKIVKLVLENTDMKNVAEMINAPQEDNKFTPLHAAAKLGRLDIVKMLLRYGATYCSHDAEDHTPLQVSSSEEVSEFLELVDECFHDAKEAKVELVHKLKAMETDDFMAVAGTKNQNNQTLAVVAAKANAKNIAGMVLRMIREAKEEK